jgi:hypothetical protein
MLGLNHTGRPFHNPSRALHELPLVVLYCVVVTDPHRSSVFLCFKLVSNDLKCSPDTNPPMLVRSARPDTSPAQHSPKRRHTALYVDDANQNSAGGLPIPRD